MKTAEDRALRLPRVVTLVALTVASLSASLLHSPAADTETIFYDDFSAMKVAMVSAGVVGAEAEYHYLPATAAQGKWEVSCFRSEESQRAWRVIRDNGFGAPLMLQASASSAAESAYTHPILVAGDSLWKDYTLTVDFVPGSDANWSGVVFRYRNDRCLYFFGVREQKASIFVLDHGTGFRKSKMKILAEKPFPYSAGSLLKAVVAVHGTHIEAELPGGVVLEATDNTFAHGRIGLMADVPTRYMRVDVKMSKENKSILEERIEARGQEESRLQAANPRMIPWKKISTVGFGTGRCVRFGDLDGDGVLDVLISQVKNHGPKDRNSEVGCLTAMTFDGKMLWQSGRPDLWQRLTGDVACQIHDLDRDGKTEVIYCRDFELVVAEGATGKILRKTKTPPSPPRKGDEINRFDRILGDSLCFADLRGQGWPGDIILKDRYSRLYAYNANLEPLWEVACNTGHYGYALDFDGDKKDEFAIGYSLLDHDGHIIWSLDEKLKDHADAVALVKLKESDPAPVFFCVASDEGVFWADLKGNILKHLYLGHVQSPSVANFRDDLPGLEAVSVNFHANQGIIHFYDSDMNVYHDFEPMQHGSMMLPLNWTGRGEEFFVISANVDEGVFDGHGRRVLKFPADGHPELCNDVLDITGDCRDEIVVWDEAEMWVYTQEDNPKPGRLYKPKRNPLYNRSNYQATTSLPGWSE